MTPALRAARLVVGLRGGGAPLARAAARCRTGGRGVADGRRRRRRACWCGALAGRDAGACLAPSPSPPSGRLLASPWGAPGDFDALMPWLAFLGARSPGRAPAAAADGLWGGAIAAWALVLSLVAPVVAARELDFTLPPPPAPNDAGMVLHGRRRNSSRCCSSTGPGAPRSPSADWTWTALAPGVAAAAGVAVWQQSMNPAFLSVEPWTGLRRSAGTFFDANATAALLALVAPILVTAAARPRALPQVVWGAALAGPVPRGHRRHRLALGARVPSPSSSACSAPSSSAAGALARGGGRRRARGRGGRGRRPCVRRIDGPRDRPPGRHSAQSLQAGPEGVWRFAWDRDGYGPAAMAMIADHPWVGTGPGTFGGLVTGYARETIAISLPPDNAQNWWRQQAAETGLLGGLPAFACSLLALTVFARALARREHVRRGRSARRPRPVRSGRAAHAASAAAGGRGPGHRPRRDVGGAAAGAGGARPRRPA